MGSVQDLLDSYHQGSITLDQLAKEFAGRKWSDTPASTPALNAGVHDIEPPDENSWEVVSSDPDLTDTEYGQLLDAVEGVAGRGAV